MYDTGELEAFAAEWGLLPRWWKPSDKQPKRSAFQRKAINARSETAAELTAVVPSERRPLRLSFRAKSLVVVQPLHPLVSY